MSGKVSTLSAAVPKHRLPAIERIFMIALIALFCAGSLEAGQTKPKKNEIRHEIFDLEDAWRNAVLKTDIGVMGNLLAEDYVGITATGMLQTKQDTLANMRSHRVHITTLLLSDRKVRFYGNTALVTSLAEVKGTTSEGDMSGSFRYTRVYVRDGQGKWKIVSWETSKIGQPFEHKKQDTGPGPE
jgi:ketosteroid isomerase-like protein